MTRNGWKWLGWLDTAVRDENGNLTAILGVGRDITKSKQMRRRWRIPSESGVIFSSIPLR